MSVLKKNKKIVDKFEKKYQVKFKNNFSDEFLRSIYSFPSVPNKNTSNLKKEILYYSILNMFNYNFWSSDHNHIYSRSNALNKILKDYIYDNVENIIYDRNTFLKKLKFVLLSQDFKMIEVYLSDIDNLFLVNWKDIEKDLLVLDFKLNQLKYIDFNKNDFQFIYINLFKDYCRFLNKYFCSYGNDDFYKREILAWNLITETIGLDNSKLIDTEYIFIPIDYRIPSVLKHSGIMKLPIKFDKYFMDKIMLSKEDEVVLRSYTYLTLNKLRKRLKKLGFGLADLQLDNKLFNMYSEINKMDSKLSHFKFNTYAY